MVKQSTPQDKLILAQRLFDKGLFKKALIAAKASLANRQNPYQTQYLLGLIYATTGNISSALFHFKKAHEISNDDSEKNHLYLNIAQCYMILQDPNNAIIYYQKSLQIDQLQIDSWFGLAQSYTRLGKPEEACEAFQKIITLTEIQSNSYIKSIAYQAVSEIDENLSNSDSKFTLAFLKQLKQDIEICTDQAALINLHFSLAKILEKQECFKQAFLSFKEANLLKSKFLNYQHHPVKLEAKKLLNFFNQENLNKINFNNESMFSPIFIVGLPRSNSTLIESLLSSSKNATAFGETTIIPELIQKISLTQNYPDLLTQLNNNDYLTLQNLMIKKYQLDSSIKSIDKLPANFWNIGLIKLIFPNSKIVHCYKPPIQACVSLFRQNFLEGHPYAYCLKDCADYYDLHIELIDHWKKLFPNQLHSINYSDFLSNPEQQSIELFEYCQIPWDLKYLTEFKNRQNVTTASSFQVRTEINSNSSKQLQNYLPHLEYLVKRYPNSD